jgi:hypothetical protein
MDSKLSHEPHAGDGESTRDLLDRSIARYFKFNTLKWHFTFKKWHICQKSSIYHYLTIKNKSLYNKVLNII